MVAPYDPYNPQNPAPGQAQRSGPPSEIRTIAVFQLVAGSLYILSILVAALFTCGLVFIGVTPLFGTVVAGLEVYNGLRGLGQRPDAGAFWWRTLPILGIVSIISGDFYSCIAGIVALILVGRPQVGAWIR